MIGRTKPCVFRVVPLHGRALAVATLFFWPANFPDRILDVFLANGGRGPHADFFAVIHERGRARGEKKSGHQLGNLVIVNAVSITIPLARLIVIAEKEVGVSVRRVAINLIE